MAEEQMPATESLAGRRILITGGTGFIGMPLVRDLASRGCELTVLTRRPEWAQQQGPEAVRWIRELAMLEDGEAFDAVINLAGESLASGRWTAAKKQRLFDSRIGTTRALYDYFQRRGRAPRLLLSGSAVGFYGHQGERSLTEQSPARACFSHRLCRDWEAAAMAFEALSSQVVPLRLGVVLGEGGGAYRELKKTFDFKVASYFGRGEHYLSWVHRLDVIGAIRFLLARERLTSGPVNVTAPAALSYRAFAEQLGRAKGCWLTLPVPAVGARLMFGEMAEELLLGGQNVKPEALATMGYEFQCPDMTAALRHLPL